MTTRNFRVHNGISVGDIVISASANTITGLATAAPSADGDVSNKKYVDDSIAAISTTVFHNNSNATVTDSGTVLSRYLRMVLCQLRGGGYDDHCHGCDQPYSRIRRCDPCQHRFDIWYR
jgi:hypothetical protein